MSLRKALLAALFILPLSFSWVNGQDASKVNKGLARLTMEPSNSYDPIAAGDNDPRLNVYHNIVALGAVGNGATDNSSVLQSAINSGFAILIPEGTFNFSATLTLRKDSMIVGIGKRSVLRYTGPGVAMREPEGSYINGYDNLKLMNFTLTTNSPSSTGIELTNNYQVTSLRSLY